MGELNAHVGKSLVRMLVHGVSVDWIGVALGEVKVQKSEWEWARNWALNSVVCPGALALGWRPS